MPSSGLQNLNRGSLISVQEIHNIQFSLAPSRIHKLIAVFSLLQNHNSSFYASYSKLTGAMLSLVVFLR